MVKPKVAAEVVYDTSDSLTRRFRSGGSASEYGNFMSPNPTDMYQKPMSREFGNQGKIENEELDVRKILEDIKRLGSSNMTWKERKKLENQNVVSLGGKPPKKHRVPLSVAKPAMKNQKIREQKKFEEDMILGRFVKRPSTSNKVEKRKPENRVLRASEGHFSKGVLDVKHLLKGNPSRNDGGSGRMMFKGKKKGKGKKNKKGKKRGQ